MSDKEQITFKHIAIEGILKSGKTKLANILSQKIGGKVIFDRIENPYLRDFYNEKEGAAFLAQLVFLVNRYYQQVSLLQRDLFEERIICDYLFEKRCRIYSLLQDRVGKPDLVIHLQISLPTLLKSIDKEGSALEKNISEKYLEDVIEAYDYFFFNYQAAPLLVVKSDGLDFDREGDIIDLLDKIKKMKKKSMYYVPLDKENKHSKKLK